MLDNSKKTNPFKVPENYFENFNSQIMEQLPPRSKEKSKAKIVPLWRKVMPWAAVAAVFLGVMVYTGFLFDNKNNASVSQPIDYTASMNENELYQFMEDEVVVSTYSDMMYDEVYAK